VHHVLVRHVRVGEHDLVYVEVRDQPAQVFLGVDGDAIWIGGPCKLGRVATSLDAGDLSGRERDHLYLRIVAVGDVEVVEVAPCGAHDQDVPHATSSLRDTGAGPHKQGYWVGGVIADEQVNGVAPPLSQVSEFAYSCEVSPTCTRPC
jgi:hypothetical protein